MTSKLKCPHCSADLESTTGGWEYGCTNAECQSAGTLCGTKELWQALIQAKQDLEIARLEMKDIDALLHSRKFDFAELGRLNIIQYLVSRALKLTEHKE